MQKDFIYWLITISLLLTGSAALANPIVNDIESMTVRYYDLGEASARNRYKTELIHQALEITRPEYGDYRIAPYHGDFPNEPRFTSFINEGKLLNLIWEAPGSLVSQSDVYTIPFDILNGLLGYRICLINNTQSSLPTIIQKTEELNNLKIGQVAEWTDLHVYKHNNVKPVLAPNFDSLFSMLGFKRFNCIALGADEVGFTYNERKARYPFLEIDKKFLIYYKYPSYIYISKKNPALAKRIEKGLNLLKKNGDFDKLFNRYHANDVINLDLPSRQVVCLKSPYINDDDYQCKAPMVYPEISKKNTSTQ